MTQMRKEKLKVGVEWDSCPICFVSYLSTEQHHPACPVGISDVMCRFCGAVLNRTHDRGCPVTTGLFPVLHLELINNLVCATCDTRFTADDCYVAGRNSVLCVACAWSESEATNG